jgi:hypothetical protein
VAGYNLPILIVLKPAVLDVMDWKKLAKILVGTGLSLMESGLLNSRIKNKSAPVIIRIPVTVRTTFACNERSFLLLLKVIISEITGKPIPPVTIRNIIIKFRGISDTKPSRLFEYKEKPALLKALTV